MSTTWRTVIDCLQKAMFSVLRRCVVAVGSFLGRNIRTSAITAMPIKVGTYASQRAFYKVIYKDYYLHTISYMLTPRSSHAFVSRRTSKSIFATIFHAPFFFKLDCVFVTKRDEKLDSIRIIISSGLFNYLCSNRTILHYPDMHISHTMVH